jgi:hypothetical protein
VLGSRGVNSFDDIYKLNLVADAVSVSHVSDADLVRITSARGQLELPLRADDTVLPGTAVLAWNLPDRSAATLVDAADAVTDLRVESVR